MMQSDSTHLNDDGDRLMSEKFAEFLDALPPETGRIWPLVRMTVLWLVDLTLLVCPSAYLLARDGQHLARAGALLAILVWWPSTIERSRNLYTVAKGSYLLWRVKRIMYKRRD